MTITWPMAVLGRCAKVSGAVRARSGRRRPEEAVMANPVDLEPQAKAVVDANAAPPFEAVKYQLVGF